MAVRETNQVLGVGTFNHPLTSEEGWGLEVGSVTMVKDVSDQGYNEASIKPPKGHGSESFQVGEHLEIWVE